jgi:hypothetical protein
MEFVGKGLSGFVHEAAFVGDLQELAVRHVFVCFGEVGVGVHRLVTQVPLAIVREHTDGSLQIVPLCIIVFCYPIDGAIVHARAITFILS